MIDSSFEWTRFHSYKIATRGSRKLIQPAGRKNERFAPFKIEPEKPLYLLFANLNGSEDACLKFAHTWGLLKSKAATEGEFLEDWRREISDLRMQIAFLEDGEKPKKPEQADAWKVTSLDVLLAPSERPVNGKRFTMLLQPKDLFGAMRLQLARTVSGGGAIRACKQCGNWFEAGAGESRRNIAIFCSEKCKNRFHYLERSKR
jgi:hypothetical protein